MNLRQYISYFSQSQVAVLSHVKNISPGFLAGPICGPFLRFQTQMNTWHRECPQIRGYVRTSQHTAADCRPDHCACQLDIAIVGGQPAGSDKPCECRNESADTVDAHLGGRFRGNRLSGASVRADHIRFLHD